MRVVVTGGSGKVGRAAVRALKAAGHKVINFDAAADTLMTRPTRDLMAEYFPGVPLRGRIGEFASPLSSQKGRRLIGYEPRHSRRKGAA